MSVGCQPSGRGCGASGVAPRCVLWPAEDTEIVTAQVVFTTRWVVNCSIRSPGCPNYYRPEPRPKSYGPDRPKWLSACRADTLVEDCWHLGRRMLLDALRRDRCADSSRSTTPACCRQLRPQFSVNTVVSNQRCLWGFRGAFNRDSQGRTAPVCELGSTIGNLTPGPL